MASSGNFPLWSPLIKGATNLSLGNTRFDGTTNSRSAVLPFTVPTGTKFYVECLVKQMTNYNITFGLVGVDQAIDTYLESQSTVNGMIFHGYNAGEWRTQALVNGSRQGFSGDVGMTATRVLGMTINTVDNEIKMYLDNTLIGNGTISISATQEYRIFCSFTGGAQSGVHMNINCGHDASGAGDFTSGGGNADENGFGDFQNSPPSGFLALCSANLPIDDDVDPAQTDDDYIGGKQHNTIVYTGNASTNAITGLGFKPDLVWIQNYSSQNQTARIQDSSRGVTKSLEPAYTTNEGTESGVTSFDSDGFTLGSATGGYNTSSASYVSWCWRANGGTTATNSDGDVDSTVQANPDAGFSIVQFPNYSGDTKFGHGLTKAPNFIIAKLISGGSNWPTYHDGYDSGKTCFLNTNAAQFSSSHFAHSGTGNPVSATTFGMGASFAGSGAGIAYCWHDVDGFQKFGSYEGNGSSDGPFIYLGFRPKLVVIRAIDSNQMWAVCDTARETFNPMGEKVLQWNADGAEFDPSGFNFDTVSNGIKIRNSDTNINSSGATFIYMAWGDVPFKYNNTF